MLRLRRLRWTGCGRRFRHAQGCLCSLASRNVTPVLEATLHYLDGQRAWLGEYALWQAQGYPVAVA